MSKEQALGPGDSFILVVFKKEGTQTTFNKVGLVELGHAADLLTSWKNRRLNSIPDPVPPQPHTVPAQELQQ